MSNWNRIKNYLKIHLLGRTPEEIAYQKEFDDTIKKLKLNPTAYASFEYINSQLLSDKKFLRRAIKIAPRIIAFVNESLKYDHELNLLAVTTSGYALGDIEQKMRLHRDISLAAVSNHGRALKFLQHFSDDIEMNVAAVNNCKEALRYVSEDMKKNKEFLYQIEKSLFDNERCYVEDIVEEVQNNFNYYKNQETNQ